MHRFETEDGTPMTPAEVTAEWDRRMEVRGHKRSMQGVKPHFMVVDEAMDISNALAPLPVIADPQTPQELFDAGWITFQQYRELTRSEPLPPETQELLNLIDEYDARGQAYLLDKIATGRSAMAAQGFDTSYKNKLPKLSSNPKLHKKAVERRRKRKNGGHK